MPVGGRAGAAEDEVCATDDEDSFVRQGDGAEMAPTRYQWSCTLLGLFRLSGFNAKDKEKREEAEVHR